MGKKRTTIVNLQWQNS